MVIDKIKKQLVLEEFYKKHYERLTYYRIFLLIDNGSNFLKLNIFNEQLINSSLILKKFIIKHKFCTSLQIVGFIKKKIFIKIHLKNALLLKYNTIKKFKNGHSIIVNVPSRYYVGVIHNNKVYKCSKKCFKKYYYTLLNKFFSNTTVYKPTINNFKQLKAKTLNKIIYSLTNKQNIINFSLNFIKLVYKKRKRRHRLKFFVKKRKKKRYKLKLKKRKNTNILIIKKEEDSKKYLKYRTKFKKRSFFLKKKICSNNYILLENLRFKKLYIEQKFLTFLENKKAVLLNNYKHFIPQTHKRRNTIKQKNKKKKYSKQKRYHRYDKKKKQ